LSARLIIMIMVVEAVNDTEAIEVLTICAASRCIVRDLFMSICTGMQSSKYLSMTKRSLESMFVQWTFSHTPRTAKYINQSINQSIPSFKVFNPQDLFIRSDENHFMALEMLASGVGPAGCPGLPASQQEGKRSKFQNDCRTSSECLSIYRYVVKLSSETDKFCLSVSRDVSRKHFRAQRTEKVTF